MNLTINLKKNLKFIVFLLIISSALFSCKYMVIENIGLLKVKKGISTINFLKIIDDNNNIRIKKYNGNPVINVKTDNPSEKSKYDVVVVLKEFGFDELYLLYIFKDDKLMYWGTPFELSCNPSAIINEIGEKVVKIMPGFI